MNRIQVYRVRASLEWFRPCGPAMMARVLRGLSDRYPGIRALFPEETGRLNKKMFDTLCQVARALPQFHRLEDPLMELGARAADAGALGAHYRIVRDELLATMADLAGDQWTHDLAADWTLVLDAMSGAMLRGAHPGAAAA